METRTYLKLIRVCTGHSHVPLKACPIPASSSSVEVSYNGNQTTAE